MNSRYKDNEEYNSFLEHVKEDRNNSSNFAKSLLSFVLGMCVVLGISIWFVQQENLVKQFFGEDTILTRELLEIGASVKGNSRTSFSLFSRSKNILLLGVDSNGEGTDKWDGTRSDTIILMNISPKYKSINAISIPRDSKVYIGNRVDKINSAHATGGIKLTKKTVEDTLGVRVDKYIIVHDNAVRDIVDALGGVDIYVEKRMNYDDYSGKLHIHLQPGVNHLNGTQSVGYLRFRHDALGDIGRTQRQQWFLKGFMEKIKSPQTITKLPELLNVARQNIKTDMSIYELSQLANVAHNFDEDSVQIATLPGGPNLHGRISYWILDSEKVQEVIDRLIYREEKYNPDNVSVVGGILYSPLNREKALYLKQQLNSMGIDVNCYENNNLPHTQFLAHNNKVSNSYYSYLKKNVKGIEKIQYVYDPVKNYCANSDFTIILANR